jgi:hypothetical protein
VAVLKTTMRTYLFILTLILCATAFGQNETQRLTISHLTKNFYIYTTFGDAGNG